MLVFILRGTGSRPEIGGRHGRPSDSRDRAAKRPPGSHQCGIGLLRYRRTGRRNPTIPRRLHAAAFGAAMLQAALIFSHAAGVIALPRLDPGIDLATR